MPETYRKLQHQEKDHGFSLIELIVVVLIIGVLLTIAVPALLSAQRTSKGRVAAANLREALSVGRAVYADLGTFDSAATAPDVPFDQSALRSAEPSLGWTGEGGNSAGPEEVSWDSVSPTEVRYAVKSTSGDCFLIRDKVSGGAGDGTTYAKNKEAPSCRAGDAASYQSSSVAAGW